MFAIVQECLERRADPAEWQAHLLRRRHYANQTAISPARLLTLYLRKISFTWVWVV
jgi:hypothetical protein